MTPREHLWAAALLPLWLAYWLFVALVCGSGCAAPRPLARPTERVVYVDEAEQVRVALEDAWLATVKLDVTTLDGGGVGSGALVYAGDVVADVLTAQHVITSDGSPRVTVWVEFSDGKKFLARVLREDWYHDLALVEVLGHVETRAIPVAAATPRRLERVWEIGAPDGEMGHVGAARWGSLHPGNGPRRPLLRWLTGGFLVDGMSGGPVIDERGRLVGINDDVHLMDAVDASDDDPEVRVPEMGSAVDWRDVRAFLERCGVPLAR